MSEFDQVLLEDGETVSVLILSFCEDFSIQLYKFQNRLHESIKLFSEICTNQFFLNTSIILFL